MKGKNMILKELKIDTWIGDPTNCYIILDEKSKELMVQIQLVTWIKYKK